MRTLCLSAALAALLVTAGCQPKGPSLEGTWTASGAETAGMPTPPKVTMTFSGNNVTIDMTMDNPQIGSIGFVGKGTFKIENDKYSHVIDDIKIDSSKVKPEVKSMVDAQLKPEELKKQMNTDTSATVKFNENGTVSMIGSKSTITLTKS